VAVCAWPDVLWDEDLCKGWYWDHEDVLDRLGVAVWKVGPRWVAEWTEDQAATPRDSSPSASSHRPSVGRSENSNVPP